MQLHSLALFQLISSFDFGDILPGHNPRRLILKAYLIGRELGLCEADLIFLQQAVILHDIGKLYLPKRIIIKTDPLDEDERLQVESHPGLGAALLQELGFPAEIIQAVWSHHENWNGSGYPRKLRGGEIPLAGSIVRVVDTLDAIQSPRPYQCQLGREEAFQKIRAGRGTFFNPDVIDVLPKLLAVH
jgi:putative nucleotidyltransferase with HDIG domain